MSVATRRPRALVTGWFSFDEVVATVGDLLGSEVTVAQLHNAGWHCDVAVAPYMGEGVDWRDIDPAHYDLLVFTTGPLFDFPIVRELVDRFAAAARWAVNVSVLDDSVRKWFDVVVERDSPDVVRADLGWAASTAAAPVIGLAFAPPQDEYGPGRHREIQAALSDWAQRRRLAVAPLDMDMFAEHRYPRGAPQIVSLIARCDVVVSMRLHAAVLALRAGRPVIAVDAVPGGGKVSRQLRQVDWPCLLTAEDCSPETLDRALQWCCTDAAADRVHGSRERALADVARTTGTLRAAARGLLDQVVRPPEERAS